MYDIAYNRIPLWGRYSGKYISGIYIIENTVNGKVYIGSSKELGKRKRDHLYYLNSGTHTNKHLQGAWNIYGENAFVFDILEFCLESNLLDRESWWIQLLDSINPNKGYNLLSADRKEVSEETRRRLSIAGMGRVQSEEAKRKISEKNKGKPSWIKGKSRSKEHTDKIIESRKEYFRRKREQKFTT